MVKKTNDHALCTLAWFNVHSWIIRYEQHLLKTRLRCRTRFKVAKRAFGMKIEKKESFFV